MDKSRVITHRAGEGTVLWWLGGHAILCALGDETDNLYSLGWGTVPPEAGPPPHSHTFAEGFYVITGELTFTTGNRQRRVAAGGFLHVGGGTAHTFKNTGGKPSDVIVIAVPAGFERFQLEVGRRLPSLTAPLDPVTPADIRRLEDAAPRYGIDLHPPASAFQAAPDVHATQTDEGPAIAVAGAMYRFLAEGSNTGGTYAAMEAIVPPGAGTPPHIHHREHEAFWVLDGEMTFYADDREFVATPGSFVHLPRCSRHHFANTGRMPARMLIIVAPAGLERYFQDVGQPMPDPSSPPPAMTGLDVEKLLAYAPKYGLEIFMPG